MPDFKIFHESLENDLRRLSAEVKLEKGSVGKPSEDKEVLRRSLEKVTSEFAPPKEQIAPPSVPSGGSGDLLPSYIGAGNLEPEVKLEIEKLIDLVFHQGLEKAVREARRRPPFIEDAFHDALVDKLLPVLRERGIFK